MIRKKGFTIMEILIVVVIFSIIAAFTIPSFSKTMNRAKRRNDLMMLAGIHSANVIYDAQTGAYAPNLAALNVDIEWADDTAISVAYALAGGGTLYSMTIHNTPALPTYTYTLSQAPLSNINPLCIGAASDYGCP